MALSWTRKAVEQLGILIRDDARVADGRYKFTEKQVGHILDLRLYQLTGLERESIKSEYDALIETIKDLLDILAKETRVLTIIKEELREIQKKYGTERRTQIVPDEGEITIEDLIANEGVHRHAHAQRLHQAHRRLRLPRPAPRRQGRDRHDRPRGGESRRDDFVEHLFTATTHDYLMFFTSERPLLRRARL